MAYEKELIAAMNNPLAVVAWRVAQYENINGRYWEKSNNWWKDRAYKKDGTIEQLHMKTCELTRKLEAAREENVAVHKDLGEAYESIRIRDERFLDDVGQYAQEAAQWKRLAYRLRVLFYVLLGLWLVVVQALLLGRL